MTGGKITFLKKQFCCTEISDTVLLAVIIILSTARTANRWTAQLVGSAWPRAQITNTDGDLENSISRFG